MERERRQRLEGRLVAAASVVVRRLPRRLALALGAGLARLYAAFDRRHVAVAEDNLRRAFPGWDAARVRRTALGVYRHFGRVALDLLWMQGRGAEEVVKLCSFEHVERLDPVFARGKGSIMVSAHIGNWEVHAIAHGFRHAWAAVVARPLDNAALDERLVALRAMSGNRVISKHRALQDILGYLRQNRMVAILMDQNVQESDGIFVEFFGRPACTTTVAAALAVKTGCGLVPVRTVLDPDGRYRLIYEPPLEWTPSGDRRADIARLTQELTRVIEGWVRDTPEQWLWLHRRWKTQPENGAAAGELQP
jgi:KDO2-lipid IV(A) lauroyltransferase